MSTSATSSRVRTGRKRTSDDAPYAAPSGAASALKRAANIDPDAVPRAKRKRLAPAPTIHHASSAAAAAYGGVGAYVPSLRGTYDDEDNAEDVVDFASLPMTDLTRYLVEFDLVPSILPSPLTAQDPPSPCSLLSDLSSRSVSPADGLGTPAMFPLALLPADMLTQTPPARRRRGSTATRSSASGGSPRFKTPILADVGDVHATLASIASKHFAAKPVVEYDTLSSFMATVKRRARARGADLPL